MNDTRDRFMSGNDAVMWNMEHDPRLRGTATTVLVLDRAPDWDRLVKIMERVSRVTPGFRERVVVPPLGLAPPRWVIDADFDLSYHLQRAAVPEPGDLRTVLDLAAAWAMRAFDPERPLWEYMLLEGLNGGQAALIQKVHHATSDGIGGMESALEFFDTERDPTEAITIPPAPEPEGSGTVWLTKEALAFRGRQVRGLAMGATRGVGRLARGLVTSPVETVGRTVNMTKSTLRMTAPVFDTLSPVMLERSTRRYFDVLEVPLDDLRRAAKSVGGTVNDVFLAGLAGGLRRYHEAQGAPAEELRVTMPISVRTDDDPLGGNRITVARYPIPVGETDPAKLVAAIHEATVAVRSEPAIEATNNITGAFSVLPPAVLSTMFGGMLFHVDLLASNVPGFPETPYLAGASADRWYAFGPTEGAALNVTLMSHGGQCCFGVASDRAAVDDPVLLTDCLQQGFDEIVALGQQANAAEDPAEVQP